MNNLDKIYEITQFFEYQGYDIEKLSDSGAVFVAIGKFPKILIQVKKRMIYITVRIVLDEKISYKLLNKINHVNKKSNLTKFYIKNDGEECLCVIETHLSTFEKKEFGNFMAIIKDEIDKGLKKIIEDNNDEEYDEDND